MNGIAFTTAFIKYQIKWHLQTIFKTILSHFVMNFNPFVAKVNFSMKQKKKKKLFGSKHLIWVWFTPG